MSLPPRDLSPILRILRDTLLGRKLKNALRFQDKLATRSPPPPNLPDGPSHKLAENYYYTRDGRHCARPPVVLVDENKKIAISAGTKEGAGETTTALTKKLGSIVPGNSYVWHESPKSQSV